MKKRVFAVLGALAPSVIFAQAQATAPEGLSDAVTALQGAAIGSINTVRPAVVAVLTALFALVALGFAWKWLRKFIGR